MYISSNYYNRVQLWLEGSANSTGTIFGNISDARSIFVTSFGDIYIDNGNTYGQINRWLINDTNTAPVMYVSQSCSGLFVDINSTLYCSLSSLHQVVVKSFDDPSNSLRNIAGTGCQGSTSNTLYSPVGIFVDINFDLYVADSMNNRIQRFNSGQSYATTVAGSTVLGTIPLLSPTSVVLDADGYLFIVDSDNHRIVGSGPTGFRCVAGCNGYGVGGSASYQLNTPYAMAFDSYGNIFVTDGTNYRIQKFVLVANSCGMYRCTTYLVTRRYKQIRVESVVNLTISSMKF